MARHGRVAEGVLHFACHGPLARSFGIEAGRGAEILAAPPQPSGRIAPGQVAETVPQQWCHREFRFADHGLRVDGDEGLPGDRSAGVLRPGQDVQEVQVRVDQDIAARSPANGAACLADFQGRLQEPARERAALLFPVGGQVIAPLLRPPGDVIELLPLWPVVRHEPQLPHGVAPGHRRLIQRKGLERAARIQPLEQHGARSGVGFQQPDGAGSAPQCQRMAFHPCLIVRKGDLERRRRPVRPTDRNHHAAVAMPREGAGCQVHS